MFEKEAEEYAVLNARQYIHNEDIGFCTSEEEVRQAYQKGAEFGYNKAFVEADKNLKAIVADFNKEKCELLGIIQGKDKVIQELEKENAELKEKVSYLEDNLRVARKDREKLQLDVAKGLKEFLKDYPATALRYLANEKYVEQLTKAKEVIKKFSEFVNDEVELDPTHPQEYTDLWVELCEKAEQFISELEK